MAGCEFNRELEIDKYVENKEIHGERFARQYLKTNMAHYRAKEAGQTVPSWDVYLTEKGLTTVDGEGLLELTEQPLTSHLSGQISGDIKMRVPIEMETVRHANALAVSGADTIFMPEHISENGGIFVRFVTRYKRDSIDQNKYQGSQIDLGKNMAPEEARIKIQDMMGNSHFVHSLQSNTYKDAYAFGTEKVKRGDNDLLSNRVRHLSIRESIPQQSPILTVEKPVRQNRLYFTDPLGHVFNDVAKIGKSVAAETVTTVIMTGKYLFERVHKKKEKKPEVSISTIKRRNGRQEIKPPEKIDRFNLIAHKRHSEMRRAKNALVIIRETDVGAGAIPFLISVLVRELPAPIKAVEKSVRSHEKKVRKVQEVREVREVRKRAETVQPLKKAKEAIKPKKERKRYREMAADGRRHTVAERVVRKEQGRRGKRRIEIGVKKVVVVEKLTPIATERREKREKRRIRRVMKKAERILESKQLSKKEKKQWVRLAVTATEFVREKKRVMRVEKNREQVAISGVRFAWMVWMILEKKNVLPEKIFSKKLVYKEHNKQEPTPWVLLSIIWYLTAIREQGMHNYPIKKKRRTLPKKGIIFSFAS